MNTKQSEHTNDRLSLLSSMGWNDHFETQIKRFAGENLIPARVIGVHKNHFRTSDGKTECLATAAGKLLHDPAGLYPVTGDWVLMKDSLISTVLVRKNVLSRGASGTRGRQDSHPQKQQILAANLDTVFIVCGLDRDFNLRRIERYLTLVYNGGLNPVIILTKADLHPHPASCAFEVETIAFGVPVHLMSAEDESGLAALAPYLSQGLTTTLIGSSGAGKSTLINRLFGKTVQRAGAVSESLGKGKHTTTSRDLFVLPQGGMVIDNPGIREIAFWDDETGVDSAFPDIEKLGMGCRFADCSHTHEPGCRVLEAVERGELPLSRLENYRKMKRELDYLADRRQKSAGRVEKERWKDIAVKIKTIYKNR
ncbi:ribosome small subunit-dependent GTPase A [Desulfatiferula olefinivorans]